MQSTRTFALLVLCVVALYCADVVFAANSVTDSSGRVWCVRTEMSPAPVLGQEIYFYQENGDFGDFITMDKTLDAAPHVYLATSEKIGIVWSRQSVATGRMEICSTTFDPESGLWVHPFSILTNPQGNVDHTEPRMEVSPSGIAHLVYVASQMENGCVISSLVYRCRENGAWSEPATISFPDENVDAPELFLGASTQGFPLVLVYLSSPQSIGYLHLNKASQSQSIRSLQKDDVDPIPWSVLSSHRLPINLR